MKSDIEAKIVASVLIIMAIFLFYTSYSSTNMIDRIGFAIIGTWIIWTVFGSYIQGRISNILRKKGDDKRGDTN